MFDYFDVELTLIRDMLGTNPCDPSIHDTHILQRQRKLIMEKGGVNTQINKYLDQIPIAKEKGEEELAKIIAKLETLIGYELSPEEKEKVIVGELESLKETFQELDLKGVTVFFWNKEKNLPCIGDHMIYGFLKAASEAVGRTMTKKNGTMLQSTSYTQSVINQHCRCTDRFIDFDRDIKRTDAGLPYYEQRSLRVITPQGPRVSLAKSEVVPTGGKVKFTLKILKNSPLTEDVLKILFSYGEMSGLGQWRNAGWGEFNFTLKAKQ
jgi:hypothetical protein